jgi:tetratricopeptide (TPR) repeat protein
VIEALRAARWVVAALAALASLLGAAPAAAGSAEELVREAHAHEAAREDDVALRRYAEALTLDPTLGDAYLGLGALRLHLGDAREAERVFATALSHVPALSLARLGRARARRALGAAAEADADLEAYLATNDDADAGRQLAAWYAEESRPLAQLAAWRRLLAMAERHADRALRKEARLTVHALELIVGDADPVRAALGLRGASSVRRGMARAEGRR